MTPLSLDASPDIPTGAAYPEPAEELMSKLDYAALAAALAPLILLTMPSDPHKLYLEMRSASDTVETLLSDSIESVARELAWPSEHVTEQDRTNIGAEVLEPFWDALRRELGVVHTCRVCGSEYTAAMRERIQRRADCGVLSGECACGNTLAWEG